MKLSLYLILGTAISTAFASAVPVVGRSYLIEDAGQLRTLVISGKGLALRPAAGSLRIKSFAKTTDADGLTEQIRRERQAQPKLAELNFLLEEPAVRGRKGATAPLLVLTCQVHVTLQEGADVDAVAQAMNVTQVDKPIYAPGQYVFHCGDQGAALELMEKLRQLPAVKSANAMLARSMRKKFTPNDIFYAYNASNPGYQWHLKNSGQSGGTAGIDLNVTTAWDTVKGTGMTIGVVDDGVEVTHPDLSGNYLASASWDFRDNDSNPAPVDADDNHGTSLAGLAAATGNNAAGISGVAPSAKFAALRIDLNTTPDDQVADALAYKNDVIQIKTNSYGPVDTGYTLEANGPLTEAALLNGVTNGRSGRGTIYTVAGGNGAMEGDNSNYDGFANSIYTIAVAGVSDDGTPTYFSEPGANLLVSALGDNEDDQSIVTTDRTGADGYNDGTTTYNFTDAGYTNDFGGTSACAPEAAGVVALILQTKSTLGWRDVQEILLSSATKNHAADNDWMTNAAGYNFNHKYGAGLINAAAAVTKATTWTNLGAQTSVSIANPAINLAIPDYPSTAGAVTSFNFATQPIVRVEHVTVQLALTHPSRGELEIILTSPSGMTSRLAERHDDLTPDYSWTFMTVRHWGENSAGTWKLQVIDREKQNTGTLTSATVKLYGTAASAPTAVPAVTSAAAATGMANVPFSYQVTATNTPTSYTVTGLPAGLTYSTSTGLISGTPTAAATTSVTLKATNGTGPSANKTLTLTVSATSGLATGLDNLRSTWVTGGNVNWSLNTTAANAHDGVDSIRPAAMAAGAYAYVKSWVEGPALLRFWWKNNGLNVYDSLYFYLDGQIYNRLYNVTTYAEDYYFIPAGRHSIRWEFYRDVDSPATGAASTGFVDQVTLVDPNVMAPYVYSQPADAFAPEGGTACFNFTAIGQAPFSYQWKKGGVNVSPNGTAESLRIQPVPLGNVSYTCTVTNGVGSVNTNPASLTVTPSAIAATLADGMDTTTMGFGTNATLGWARQTTVTHDGVDALQSGAIGNSASSVLQSCITGPATLTFWWKVSSEDQYDYLDLKLDGVGSDSLTGEIDWEEKTLIIPSGVHTVEWNFNKDSSDLDPVGSNAGYIDGISIVANGYAAWQALQFSIAQQNTAGTTDILDDPDKDGLVNLVEYGLGLDPNVNTRSGLPVTIVDDTNLEFIYVDDWDRYDVLLIPEVSAALDSGWTEVTPTEVSVEGNLHTMKVTLPLNGGKSFVRLRVTEF